MAWWSWLLIWGALVLAMLGMPAWLGYLLFRKAARTVEALERLGEQVAALELDPTNPTNPPGPRFRPAVFEETEDMRLALESVHVERLHRRQVRRDNRVARGKLLQHAPTTQRTEPHA